MHWESFQETELRPTWKFARHRFPLSELVQFFFVERLQASTCFIHCLLFGELGRVSDRKFNCARKKRCEGKGINRRGVNPRKITLKARRQIVIRTFVVLNRNYHRHQHLLIRSNCFTHLVRGEKSWQKKNNSTSWRFSQKKMERDRNSEWTNTNFTSNLKVAKRDFNHKYLKVSLMTSSLFHTVARQQRAKKPSHNCKLLRQQARHTCRSF